MEVIQINVENLKYRKDNRKSEKLTPITSVKTEGILHPLYVIERANGMYEVAAGNRRLLSAKEYGLLEVPCVVVRNKKEADIIHGLENIDRLPLNPVDLSADVNKMIKAGYTLKQVTDITGRSERFIKKLIKIENLIPVLKDQLATGEITLDAAAELTALSPEKQKEAAEVGWIADKDDARNFIFYDYPTLRNVKYPEIVAACAECENNISCEKNDLFEEENAAKCQNPACLKEKVAAYSREHEIPCISGWMPEGEFKQQSWRQTSESLEGMNEKGVSCYYERVQREEAKEIEPDPMEEARKAHIAAFWGSDNPYPSTLANIEAIKALAFRPLLEERSVTGVKLFTEDCRDMIMALIDYFTYLQGSKVFDSLSSILRTVEEPEWFSEFRKVSAYNRYGTLYRSWINKEERAIPEIISFTGDGKPWLNELKKKAEELGIVLEDDSEFVE